MASITFLQESHVILLHLKQLALITGEGSCWMNGSLLGARWILIVFTLLNVILSFDDKFGLRRGSNWRMCQCMEIMLLTEVWRVLYWLILKWSIPGDITCVEWSWHVKKKWFDKLIREFLVFKSGFENLRLCDEGWFCG